MTLVVNASVAVKWFVEEDGRAQALRVLELDGRQAPDLIVAEVANGVWKKALRGQVTDAQARAICTALPRYFGPLHASAALVENAIGMSLALRHPIYDCLYLACAAREGRLVTADRRLVAAVANTSFAVLAVHIDALAGPYAIREAAPQKGTRCIRLEQEMEDARAAGELAAHAGGVPGLARAPA